MTQSAAPFMNPASVASYAEDAPKKVPGLADLHRMTTLLLAEHAAAGADILVVGAGGGMELMAMAEARPGWRFTGVDPSPAMLALAGRRTAAHSGRIRLIEGVVDQVPPDRFDGATCLLTLHFLDRSERLHTLREINRRLAPGSAVVIAHHTAPQGRAEHWLTRSAAFAGHGGDDPARAKEAGQAMAARLPLLTPDEEEALLQEAGFSEPTLFYAALSFRGWFAVAGRQDIGTDRGQPR